MPFFRVHHVSAHQRDVYKGNTSSNTCPRIRETFTRGTLRPSRFRASERRIQGNTSSITCPRIRETYTRGTLRPSRVRASERRIQGEHFVHHVSTHQRDVYKGNTSSIKKLSGHSRCSLERYYCNYYQVDMF